MFDFEEIRVRVTIQDILADTEIDSEKNRTTCPIHGGDNPTSFSFTESAFLCFSCGAKGGLVDLVQYLHNCSREEALRHLCRLAGIPFDDAAGRGAGLKQRVKPRPLSPLQRNDEYRELQGQLGWVELKRQALLVCLKLNRWNMRDRKIPLADYYTKKEYYLWKLEESDGVVAELNYKINEIKRGIHSNDRNTKRTD